MQQVNRAAGADPAWRFELFLQVLVENADRLVVYLDNLESLLVEPEEIGPADPDALGRWHTPALQAIWATLKEFAQHSGRVVLVASCRYRNDDFGNALIPLGPLPAEALLRLMGWFPGLRRLSVESRARLAAKLDGHPRAVEFANDLVEHALDAWEEQTGRDWILPTERTADVLVCEWREIVEPALPKVADRLGDDLLFREIWDHVLDDRARRMLYRMTLLRRPWDLELERELGEPGEPAKTAEATAKRLGRTSLLEQVELTLKDGPVRHETIHPATAQFVARKFGDDPDLRREANGRVGQFYEARARTSPYIEDDIEAGHHLFQAMEYDRANDMLGPASDWLQNRGRVREGLQLLEPFLADHVRVAMTPERVGRLLGTVGLAYVNLGQVERAIEFHEQDAGHRPRDRRSARRGERTGKPGVRLPPPGPGGTGHRLLRAAARHHPRDRRPAGREERTGKPGLRLLQPGPGGAGHRILRAGTGHLPRAQGPARRRGRPWATWALAYAHLGQVERAIEFYEQHLIIARKIGDRQGEGTALGNLGIAYKNLGQVERAIDSYEQALVIAREIGDRQGEGTALGSLGIAYARLGQEERAIGFLEQAVQIGEEIKDPRLVRIVTDHLERLHGDASA